MIFSKIARTFAGVVGIILLVPFTIHAQSQEAGQSGAGQVLAEINLGDALIVSNTAEKLTVTFTIVNQAAVPQSDIRYGIELALVSGETLQITDSYVSPETDSIAAKGQMVKIVEYPLLGVASGDYEVLVTARTTGGLVLGMAKAGVATISNSEAVSFLVDTCELTVDGSDTTYHLSQGVDISSDENLQLVCAVKNYGTAAKTVVPVFETYRRSVFGEKEELAYPTFPSETIGAGEQKTLTFNLPKATTPQAYEVNIALADVESKAVVSNHIATHYVLRGASATIQNINFDKTSYAAGEEMSLSLFWTGSADAFFDSRSGTGTAIVGNVAAKISITDSAGSACVAPINQTVAPGEVVIKAVATTNCVSPKAVISLVDQTGLVLDERTIEVKGDEVVSSSSDEGSVPNNRNPLMLITFIAFALTLLVMLVVMARHKKVDVTDAAKLLVLTVMAGGAMFGGVHEADAAVWNHRWSNSEGWHNHTVTVNLTRATAVYSPGETVSLSSMIRNADCLNNSIPIHRLTATLGVTTITLSENPLVNTHGDRWGSGNFTAPATPGTYTINLTMTTLNRNEQSFSSITFTVVSPVPNQPASITATCNAPGNPVSISWAASAGATYYAFRISPGSIITDVTGTSYNTFVPTLDTAYSTWVHACNASGCSVGVASTNFTCTTPPPPPPPPPAPSASISVDTTPCHIQAGNSTCTAVVTWNIQNAIAPNVKNTLTNTLVSNDPVSNSPEVLDKGVHTFVAYDGSTPLNSVDVDVDCALGTSWDGSVCAVVPPPPPSPIIDLDLSRELIRSGETVDIIVDVEAEYRAECTMYGAQSTPVVFTHSGTPADPTSNRSFTSRPLSAAQVITVTCEPDPANGASASTATSRVDVIPVVEEI